MHRHFSVRAGHQPQSLLRRQDQGNADVQAANPPRRRLEDVRLRTPPTLPIELGAKNEMLIF